jgi:hypothetical protein
MPKITQKGPENTASESESHTPTQVQIKNEISSKLRSARKNIRDSLKRVIESISRILFFWETDSVKLGYLIRDVHAYAFHAIVISYILLHTFYQSYWGLVTLWSIITVVWLTQVLAGTCVITSLEKQLTGEDITIMDPILRVFNIPITRENRMGFTILLSTLSVSFLSLELWSRSILNIQEWIYLLFPTKENNYAYIG